MASQTSRRGNSDKRERILAAAVKVFATHGFYNSKVHDVAEVAGVADGTIYLYFKNKDDLLISAFEDRMERINRRLRDELAQITGALPRLHRCMELHLLLALEDRDLAEFITVELRQSSKFIKEYKNKKFGEYLGILRNVILQGQQEGSLRADLDAGFAARAIFGAADEALLALVLGHKLDREHIEERARALELLFMEGLRARPAT
jgi:TetR/AcrR family fatty acid metabolism transcriptional regulator